MYEQSYKFIFFTATLVMCALVARTLTLFIPAKPAVIFAMIAASIWARNSDIVGKRLRSDVERILQPNKPTEAALLNCWMIGLLCAVALANIIGAMFAAPIGLM